MPSTIVVVPTYNEKGNLKLLVERIFVQKIPGLKMIVVDDNSPDGTGDFAESLVQSYPLTVVHRDKKRGLGTAYTQFSEK